MCSLLTNGQWHRPITYIFLFFFSFSISFISTSLVLSLLYYFVSLFFCCSLQRRSYIRTAEKKRKNQRHLKKQQRVKHQFFLYTKCNLFLYFLHIYERFKRKKNHDRNKMNVQVICIKIIISRIYKNITK